MVFKLDGAALQEYLVSIFPQIADDFEFIKNDGDRTLMRLKAAERHLRPGGTISGPSIFALADCAFYAAILARLGKVPLAVTTNCAIDFLRKPAAATDLIGEARILKQGRVLIVGDVLIRSEGQTEVVAHANLTYSVPPKPSV